MCLFSVFIPYLSTARVGSTPTSMDIDESVEVMEPERGGNTNGDWISYFIALGVGKIGPWVSGLGGKKVKDVDVRTWSRGIS